MAGLNEEGQWIVLMGIIVCIGLFFLAFILNQSTLVGQTTAEGVLEFPKNDIQDLREEVCRWVLINTNPVEGLKDIQSLSLYRKNAVIYFSNIYTKTGVGPGAFNIEVVKIHFNNGVTIYDAWEEYCVRP